MRSGSSRRRAVAGATVLLLWTVATSGSAFAHGTPVSLAVWGTFPKDAARCQREISHAAAMCIKTVVDVRRDCLDDQLAGTTCNNEETSARVDAARTRALDAVESSCSELELQNLGYIDMSDALTDIIDICRQVDTAAISAVYGPAMVGGSVAAVDDVTRRCVDSAGRAATKLMRYGLRARQRALDEIAAGNFSPSEKQALIDHSTARIDRARATLQQRIVAVCPDAEFDAVYNRDVESFLTTIGTRADCLAGFIYVQDEVVCPAPQCGNGMEEHLEECDDGNDFDNDGCRADCMKSNCSVFPSTFDLVQQAIFENHGCTDDACHGSSRQGNLDLRAGSSYENLIDVPATTVPGYKRIDPGNKDRSLLWINLAAGTLPDDYTAPVRPMPLLLPPLSQDELEALRIWIETGGAARHGAIPGTAERLDACLPEPIPGQIEPLPAPLPDEGIQMHMPAWTLAPKSESEVCYSSYYDFTGKIPEALLSPDGKRFRYKSIEIRQDPLSHHLIVDLYRGTESPNDPRWGPYTCKGGPKHGDTCNPLELGFCGTGDCATEPDPSSIACIDFGPQENNLSTLTQGGFAFAQETTAVFQFPSGVYDELPVKGVVLWNSHAFNLTRRPGSLQAWVNVYFPEATEQRFPQIQIFNTTRIFWKDLPGFPLLELPPFQQHEICNVHVFGRPTERFFGSDVPANKTAHLFELSGHMHRHGKRFQIFRGYFTCDGGSRNGDACSPLNEATCPQGTCVDAGGRSGEEALMYTNFVYNDPVVLRFNDPLLISGSAPVEDRSLTYCGVYDNGTPPNELEVKRRSTSPPAGQIFDLPIGGPCALSATRCIGGPHHNEVCGGNNALCDSETGANDGDCDACPLTGGFRTEDEMFILFGNYWLE